MKRRTSRIIAMLGLAALFTPANIAGCGALGLLGGCGPMRLKGNGELYIEYGTKIAVGQHTEKADETQVATSSIDWGGGPIAWLFDWLTAPKPVDATETE